MKRLETFFKVLLCKHEYEFISKYIKTNNGKAKHYGKYKCIKCDKRKEFRIE